MRQPLSPRETRRSGRRSLQSASASNSKSPDADIPPKFKDPLHRLRIKDKPVVDAIATSETPPDPTGISTPNILEEEEEQGITRCVCGGTGDDDPDAGEFMVQCETCNVWQHGLCMGFESEDQLHDDNYYCEQCKPELHKEILRKRFKRPRQPLGSSHNSATALSRLSRSHSPSTLKQPSKRRNTMNSRDAAFDESLKELIEATAAEAAAHDTHSVTSNGNRESHLGLEDDIDSGYNARRKRKRVDEDHLSKKRTRSASTTSEQPAWSATQTDIGGQVKSINNAGANSKPPGRSNKRGGKRALPLPTEPDCEDAKRLGNSSRTKVSTPSTNEQGARRNQTTTTITANVIPSASESSRNIRQVHACGASQQTLHTSWNLPDYLAHLEPMLPTHTPQPLEVRGGVSESVDLVVERGVKVRWPGKRMSVGDMNKRVRSLVEWVGREQAATLDRTRRRDTLSNAVQGDMVFQKPNKEGDRQGVISDLMVSGGASQDHDVVASRIVSSTTERNGTRVSTTMKQMEELMEELICFQERFGPGARNRERRLVP